MWVQFCGLSTVGTLRTWWTPELLSEMASARYIQQFKFEQFSVELPRSTDMPSFEGVKTLGQRDNDCGRVGQVLISFRFSHWSSGG